MKMRPIPAQGVSWILEALRDLRHARDLLKRADCPQSVDRVRAAITSTEGAYRHALHREREAGTCGDEQAIDGCHPQDGTYRCNLPVDHPGDHIDLSHPLHPSWKAARRLP